jgi:hypothetical protein
MGSKTKSSKPTKGKSTKNKAKSASKSGKSTKSKSAKRKTKNVSKSDKAAKSRSKNASKSRKGDKRKTSSNTKADLKLLVAMSDPKSRYEYEKLKAKINGDTIKLKGIKINDDKLNMALTQAKIDSEADFNTLQQANAFGYYFLDPSKIDSNNIYKLDKGDAYQIFKKHHMPSIGEFIASEL